MTRQIYNRRGEHAVAVQPPLNFRSDDYFVTLFIEVLDDMVTKLSDGSTLVQWSGSRSQALGLALQLLDAAEYAAEIRPLRGGAS